MTAPALPAFAFAAVLGLAAIVAAIAAGETRPAVRAPLRFAAALAGALAAADAGAALMGGPAAQLFAGAVTLLVAALAPAMLALAAQARLASPPGTPLAALALAAACAAGLLAAATGSDFLAFVPLLAAAAAMAALALRRWGDARKPALLLGLAGFSLIAAAASFLSAGEARITAFALFFAAALLGVTVATGSDAAVHKRARRAGRDLSIRRKG